MPCISFLTLYLLYLLIFSPNLSKAIHVFSLLTVFWQTKISTALFFFFFACQSTRRHPASIEWRVSRGLVDCKLPFRQIRCKEIVNPLPAHSWATSSEDSCMSVSGACMHAHRHACRQPVEFVYLIRRGIISQPSVGNCCDFKRDGQGLRVWLRNISVLLITRQKRFVACLL